MTTKRKNDDKPIYFLVRKYDRAQYHDICAFASTINGDFRQRLLVERYCMGLAAKYLELLEKREGA